jgi:ABC-type uncharacterized transport system auxiliary subunit
MAKIRTAFISASFLFVLTGCINLTTELPSYTTYTLGLQQNNIKNKYYDVTIHVKEPRTLNSINSKKIVYSKDHLKQEAYALSKWSDKPTKMLQQTVANHLTLGNSYKYIITSNLQIKSDYSLKSELVEFKQTFSKTKSYANLSIRVYFINNKTDKVYFKQFSYNKLSNKNNAQGVVTALNSISNTFLIDLESFIQNSLKVDNL